MTQRSALFAPIEDAVAAIGRGEIVVVVDDEDRENEGDLIMAAEFATPEKIAFFVHHTSGVICAPLTGERLRRARPAADGRAQHRDAAHRVPRHGRLPPRHDDRHLGRPIARRRSRRSSTRRPDPATSPVPVTSSRCATGQGGVLKRAGHTEATVDLARLAGLYPAGVLCEIVNDDGSNGPRARPRAVLRRARPADDLDRRPDPLPAPHREARPPRRRGPHPDAVGRLHLHRVRVDPRRRAAPRVRPRRRAGHRRRARPRAQRVPHRRRVRLAACDCGPQLDAAMADDRRRRTRRRRVPPRPRGPRHRHRPQDPRLQPAGPGPRHRRREHRARPARRQPRVRHRRADPRRPRHHDDAADDEQPRASTAVSRASASRSSSGCRSRCARIPRTSTTCAPSASGWATCSDDLGDGALGSEGNR